MDNAYVIRTVRAEGLCLMLVPNCTSLSQPLGTGISDLAYAYVHHFGAGSKQRNRTAMI
ncbi:uncharacterized protein CTRU02_203403 [Colletotrichum truncatum]|uniref:Uncharacterized protein n=1 Tax=Colletotrichum truncatum TaxID=5467 RepID=A0ACC3Z999_COLTU|nr:uncharacterized protein CTRU02_05786 [Colletotrichum truncatum]KAF6793531.1 hypothetical protein CTRU02_05786 [Colletotrichum truncatum]